MKKTTIILATVVFTSALLLLASHPCSAQGTWLWAKNSVGNNLDDQWGIDTDNSGNVYVSGKFFSDTLIFGSDTLYNNAFGSVYLAKYDASGNVLWARSAGGTGGTGNGRATFLDVDASGNNIYLSGEFGGNSITFGSITLPNAGSQDVFIAKYDGTGNLLWAQSAGGVYEDRGMGLAVDASGNVYATGYFQSAAITFGANTLTHVGPPGWGQSNLFFVKYDPAGNVLWAQNGSDNEMIGFEIAVSPSGNDVYLIGGFRGTVTFGSTTLTYGGGYDEGFIVKYDPAGNVIWAKQSLSGWKMAFQGVTVDPTGQFVYVGGLYHQTPIAFGSITLPFIGSDDGFIVKYDASSGNALCAQYLNSPLSGSVVSVWGIGVDPAGYVYTAGRALADTIHAGSFLLPIPYTPSPMFVMVFDQNCNAVCGDALEDGGNIYGHGVATNALGDIYIASTFDNLPAMQVGSTTLTHNGGGDAFVAKYVKCTSSTLNVTATTQSVSCSGQCTGTGTANPSGGTSPYTYSWNSSPAQNTQTATGLCSGNYVCTVTDGTGSTATAPVTITQPSAITSSANSTPATCGSNNGTSTVTASGGTGGLTYSWAPTGGNAATVTGLSAGNYTCTITDSKGCTKTATVSITSSGGPAVTTSTTPQTCTQGGTAAANPSGGTTPYTYQWCNGATTSATSGLSAGTCTVIVTDAGGCSTANTVTITSSGSIPAATATATAATCGNNNGTATATASGGTSPYTYQWNTGQNTSAITGLSGGSYTVTVTDATGCTAVQTVNVSQTSAVTATTTSTPSSCNSNNGAATATASGGTSPYTYLWNPSGQTASAATGLSAGTYTIIITDATGCTQTSVVSVAQTGGPTASASSNVTITQGQTATLTANGGGTYQWSSGSTQNQISVTPTTTTVYCVTVTDAGNCSDSACVTVTVEIEPIPCGAIFVPNAFSPNSDGENELECVLGGCIQTLAFTIYDRWGEKVFEYSGSPLPSGGAGGGPCWDGMYKGKLMNTATFVYYLKAVLTNGEQITKKGNVSLIR